MNSIEVLLKDAMDARLILERHHVTVIFVESTKTTSKFVFRASNKKRERLVNVLRANGIYPVSKKSYLSKSLKRRRYTL